MTLCALLPSRPHLQQQYQNGESEENHEQFLKALQNAVSTFLNRMKSNHMRGRSITNDSAVLSLFQSINNMHPQLLDILNQLDEKRCECYSCMSLCVPVLSCHSADPVSLTITLYIMGSVLRGAAGQVGSGA